MRFGGILGNGGRVGKLFTLKICLLLIQKKGFFKVTCKMSFKTITIIIKG